jgi:hypothetical protein
MPRPDLCNGLTSNGGIQDSPMPQVRWQGRSARPQPRRAFAHTHQTTDGGCDHLRMPLRDYVRRDYQERRQQSSDRCRALAIGCRHAFPPPHATDRPGAGAAGVLGGVVCSVAVLLRKRCCRAISRRDRSSVLSPCWIALAYLVYLIRDGEFRIGPLLLFILTEVACMCVSGFLIDQLPS